MIPSAGLDPMVGRFPYFTRDTPATGPGFGTVGGNLVARYRDQGPESPRRGVVPHREREADRQWGYCTWVKPKRPFTQRLPDVML